MEKNIKLIIAEDEKFTRRIVSALLESEKWSIDLVENGVEALDKIEDAQKSNNQYSLLLSDIHMPIMGGIELITEIKKKEIDIPIIAITGEGDKKIIIELMRIGCSDYVEKPFSSKVIPIIKQVIEKHLEQKIKKEDAERGTREKLKEYEYNLKQAESTINKAVTSYKSLINITTDKLLLPVEYEFHPLSFLGGDYMDVINTENGVNIVVADVSGHDIGASYYAIMLKMMFNEYGSFDGELFFDAVNRKLSETGEFSRMVTAVFLSVNKNDKTIEMLSAGHPAPVKIDLNGKASFIDRKGSHVLGIFDNPEFEKITFKMKSGEKLFAYTDGLLETSLKTKEGKRIYIQPDEFLKTFEKYSDKTLGEITSEVFNDIQKISHYKRTDDILALGFEMQ